MENNMQKIQQTENKEEIELEDQKFTCEICIGPSQSKKKIQNGNLCVHPFCEDCIAKYIDAKLELNLAKIECPGQDCNQPLDPFSCTTIISKEIFVRWCDVLCNLTVLEFDYCYCPNRNCSALVLNECKDDLKKTKCPNCNKDFCFQCKVPWHSGYLCDEIGLFRDRNDILLGKLIEQEKWARCYYCRHAIEQNGGCRIIRCRCGHEFCYKCSGRPHIGDCDGNICCGRRVSLMWFGFILLLLAFMYTCF